MRVTATHNLTRSVSTRTLKQRCPEMSHVHERRCQEMSHERDIVSGGERHLLINYTDTIIIIIKGKEN